MTPFSIVSHTCHSHRLPFILIAHENYVQSLYSTAIALQETSPPSGLSIPRCIKKVHSLPLTSPRATTSAVKSRQLHLQSLAALLDSLLLKDGTRLLVWVHSNTHNSVKCSQWPSLPTHSRPLKAPPACIFPVFLDKTRLIVTFCMLFSLLYFCWYCFDSYCRTNVVWSQESWVRMSKE